MENTTATTNPMKRTAVSSCFLVVFVCVSGFHICHMPLSHRQVRRCAWLISFAVCLVDVCACHGAVMARMTALITVMKKAVKRQVRSIKANLHLKSSFPKRYKSILIVFMKMTFFLPRPIHFVNIQFILLKWSVGSV